MTTSAGVSTENAILSQWTFKECFCAELNKLTDLANFAGNKATETDSCSYRRVTARPSAHSARKSDVRPSSKFRPFEPSATRVDAQPPAPSSSSSSSAAAAAAAASWPARPVVPSTALAPHHVLLARRRRRRRRASGAMQRPRGRVPGLCSPLA